jgi:hypothetical protein
MAKSFKLPAPGGKFYHVELYPSCGNCIAPAGVSIDLYSKDDFFAYELTNVTTVRPETGYNNGVALAVIGIEQLHDAIKEVTRAAIGTTIKDKFDADILAEEVTQHDGLYKIVMETQKAFPSRSIEDA